MIDNLEYIAFIFARGGSKGLPKKNIKLLKGKPLIQYSIEAANKSNFIKEIYVSTDDADISSVAKKLGVNVIERPKYLATDNSPEWLSWQHAIKTVLKEKGEFDRFISLPTTSPLRSTSDIDDAIIKYQKSSADICIAITPSNRSPYFNMVEINDKDLIDLVLEPESEIFRRQECPDIFDITTSVYVSNPNFILSNNSIFSGSVSYITVPKERAVDIDDIYDFMLAECILEKGDAR